jgi:hypothetical protein
MVWALLSRDVCDGIRARQMVCGADTQRILRLLQAMNGSKTDLAQALPAASEPAAPPPYMLLEKGVL